MIVTGVQQSEQKLQDVWWPKLIFSMMSLPKVLLAKASHEANTDPRDKEVDSATCRKSCKGSLYRTQGQREMEDESHFCNQPHGGYEDQMRSHIWRSLKKIYKFMQGINIVMGVSFFLSMG